MPDRVVVRAPATVANLGPGFDALGCALRWYDEIRVERHDGPLEITASGLGAEGVRRDETNYVAIALRMVLGEIPPVRIHKMTSVAYGRGFGSSAISIVAGLVAARALGATAHTDDDLLAMAIELEGHPDNVAPCLLGGVTVCSDGRVLRFDAPADVSMLVCAAPSRLATKAARAALPESVARAVLVESVGRSSMLAAALATGRQDLLFTATQDSFHQPARFALMPDSGDLVAALRAQGIAAFLSGAGPSVSALVPTATAEQAERIARERAPEGWQIHVEPFDGAGAHVAELR